MNSVSLGEEDIAWSIVYLCRRETRAGTSSYCSDNSRRPDARPHARPRSRPRVALASGSEAEGGVRLELDVGDSSKAACSAVLGLPESSLSQTNHA